MAAIVRDPPSLALLCGSAFGIPVMVHAPPAGAPIASLSVLLLALGVQSVTGMIILTARGRSETAAGVALLGIAGLLAALLWSLAVGAGSIVSLIPPVHWAGAAIASAARERWGEAAFPLLLLSVIPPIALTAGTLLTEERRAGHSSCGSAERSSGPKWSGSQRLPEPCTSSPFSRWASWRSPGAFLPRPF